MGRGGNAYTSLYDGGVLAMTWTAAKVGVSTTAAPKNLTVYFQSTDTSLAGEGLAGGSAGDGVLLYNNSTTTNAYANLDFRTGDSDGRIAYRRTGTNAGDFCFVTDNSGSPECKLYLYDLGGAKLYSSNSTASNIQFTIHNDKSDDSAVLALQAERTSLNDTGQIRFINKDNDIAAIRSYGGGGSSNQDGQLRFYTRQDSDGGVSERLRITEIGYSLFNCTSVPSSSVAGMAIYGSSSANMSSSGSSTSSYIHWNFFNGNGQVGYISTSGSTTTFSTSSDYRLKENLTPLTGALDRIGQLPVYRFNFKADKNTTVDGFLAHEVQSHVPEAVTGEKDAMKTVEIEAVLDDNGNELEPARTEEQPDYQGIDQSKLVPLLVAAIQELKAEVEALKNAK
jgi:hypothetical protein